MHSDSKHTFTVENIRDSAETKEGKRSKKELARGKGRLENSI